MSVMTGLEGMPDWVPGDARLYLVHTEAGVPLRALARCCGLHPSTVMRRVRRFEGRRDDPLVDEALDRLGRAGAMPADALVPSRFRPDQEPSAMSAPMQIVAAKRRPMIDDATLQREARRILRRLCESGAVLAIAGDLDKAVVLRGGAGGGAGTRTAVVERAVAQAFALKEWIACDRPGRVSLYGITAVGRAALRRMLAADAIAEDGADAPTAFAGQHADWEGGRTGDGAGLRRNMAESPVALLARRRGKDGAPFLAPGQVAAAERLREDFEVAQMGPRVAQNWDRFLTGGERGSHAGRGPAEGPSGARDRVAAALRDLGPGLGDVALRCCCFLEGLEAVEQRMGWSARSGKIVLRIALTRLARHYESLGERGKMIG